MRKNVGTLDRWIRIAVAAIIAILYYTETISGTVGIALLIFGLILILTALFSFCGLYTLFGINTCKLKEKQ